MASNNGGAYGQEPASVQYAVQLLVSVLPLCPMTFRCVLRPFLEAVKKNGTRLTTALPLHTEYAREHKGTTKEDGGAAGAGETSPP